MIDPDASVQVPAFVRPHFAEKLRRLNPEKLGNEVLMENTSFDPRELTVETGTMVIWQNEDSDLQRYPGPPV